MAAPDSPWISGTWRPAFGQKYQDLWAQGQKHPGMRSTSECKPDHSEMIMDIHNVLVNTGIND